MINPKKPKLKICQIFTFAKKNSPKTKTHKTTAVPKSGSKKINTVVINKTTKDGQIIFLNVGFFYILF